MKNHSKIKMLCILLEMITNNFSTITVRDLIWGTLCHFLPPALCSPFCSDVIKIEISVQLSNKIDFPTNY